MAYFRSFFGGAQEEERSENGAEVVEKLVERVETSTALEDRRDALKALRSIAKTMRLAVGTMGMSAFIEILENERANLDLVTITLEILVAVLSSADENTDDDELGERLAEVMLKKTPFIPSLLTILEQFEFGVRRAGIQLLASLLRHRGAEVQQKIMGQPMGLSRLVDLLHESREAVRNEAILMLCELSRANGQIQQLLAYENAFQLLLSIIELEPRDSIVVEDCLFVILNLVRRNPSNQQLFRENNLVARLGALLHTFLFGLEDDDAADDDGTAWPKQQTANVIFLLQILRALVAPENTAGNTHAAQKAMHHARILAELCRVIMSELGVSIDVLTETVIVVAEVIRGNYANQEFFAGTSLAVGDGGMPRPSLIVLLQSLTAEKQPFKLRLAVFYAFLCYLHDNEFGKARVVETLLPSAQPDEPPALSTGSLIVQALVSTESVQSWFGAVSFTHVLLDVEHLRSQLLRVRLSLVIDAPPEALINHVQTILVSLGSRRAQVRAGLLMLLGVWVDGCPAAAQAITTNEETIHYLTTQFTDSGGEGSESESQVLRGLIAFLLAGCLESLSAEGRGALEPLLQRRVGGREALADALDGISRTEQFVRAAQKAQPLAKAASELFLDFGFVKFFKAKEGALIRSLRPHGESWSGPSNNENIVASFKELIKRQDEEISVLKANAKKTAVELEDAKRVLAERAALEGELQNLRRQIVDQGKNDGEVRALKIQIEQLMSGNQQWQMEVNKYKAWAEQWQAYQVSQLPNPQEAAIALLSQQKAEVDQQLAYGWQAFEAQSEKLRLEAEAGAAWKTRAETLEGELNEERNRKVSEASSKVSEELSNLKAEQEDLLVLLADQHSKLGEYRARLKSLGQEVSDAEDDEEDVK